MPVVDEPGQPHERPADNATHGRLSARPTAAPGGAGGRTGTVTVTDAAGGFLAEAYVPAGDGPYRLLLMLHGAGGSARQGLDLVRDAARRERLLLVAPQSAAPSWDVIHGGFGPDVRRIDRVLTELFAAYPVDGVAVGGFSDGASYAITLGMSNGDLFDAVLAFSPGFAAPLVTHGRARIFVAHGDGDRVLPIDRCSRRLVPRLRTLGHPVTYEEFAGGHDVPPQIREHAVAWLLSGEPDGGQRVAR